MTAWSFLTNHARVLVCIAHDPGVRLRDIATTVSITERSAYAIVTDLTTAGYVVKDKDTDGRRNRYQKPSDESERSVRSWTCSSTATLANQPEKRVGEPRRDGARCTTRPK
jgi:DNA-binding MarR family transcriptional regulator